VLDVDPLVLVAPGQPAGSVIEALTWRCIGTLRRLERAGLPPGGDPRVGQLVDILTDLRELAFDLHQREVDRRARGMSECAVGLTRLRDLRRPADLLDQVCGEATVRCGCERSVLSRVEDGRWRPWMAYFREPREYESWFTAWIEQSISLDEAIPETQLVADARPAVVYDTASTNVSREIVIDSAQSTAYVVAPIVVGAEVVGFMHADHGTGRQVGIVDRDLLWAFMQGFGHLYERAMLLERVSAQRDHVRRLLAAEAGASADPDAGQITLGGRASTAPEPVAASTLTAPGVARVSLSGLTARETEVLGLMAGGASNRAIAERLIISEVTVKSHVQHILRKLGAANRTQAVALALGLGYQ
jgi:DNA-binding CsgD family transcriptional regulator